MMPTKTTQKTKYRTFSSSEEMNWFFKRNINPVVEDKIEYCVMEKFAGNRILFTAEHAQTKRVVIKEFGSHAYAGIGDKNTDVLAKIGACYLRSAYLIPLFARTEADASRPPEDLGKGLRLFVRAKHAKQKTVYIPIHSSISMLPHLNKYHKIIEKLNPNVIVSIHGLNIKRKFDLLFGFGENYNCAGGKKEAFKFKNEFMNYLDHTFSEFGIRENLKIAVSTWRFTGSQNYILTKHIIEHNRHIKDPKKKRIGLQAEFNLRGRVTKKDDEIPTITYQLVVQALSDFIFKSMNPRD